MTLLTPPPYAEGDARWDTWRNCEFNEILAFNGLAYWYTWQVSILGLGPIWMSLNAEAKRKAAAPLRDGAVFALGLSQRATAPTSMRPRWRWRRSQMAPIV